MGSDARIYFRAKVEPELFQFPYGRGYTISKLPEVDPYYGRSDRIPDAATHEVDCPGRYYSETYQRGDWPMLGCVLMNLLASPEIETVWYGGDEHINEFTADDWLRVSAHYLKRPAPDGA